MDVTDKFFVMFSESIFYVWDPRLKKLKCVSHKGTDKDIDMNLGKMMQHVVDRQEAGLEPDDSIMEDLEKIHEIVTEHSCTDEAAVIVGPFTKIEHTAGQFISWRLQHGEKHDADAQLDDMLGDLGIGLSKDK